MRIRPSLRDLLDTMRAAAPEGTEALARARNETLALLLALFGPAEGEPDPVLRARIGRALDAVMEERRARRLPGSALRPA